MTAEHDVPRGTTASPDISMRELRLAARNHGMPLEALRRDITPVGLHYLLIHYDIPLVDPDDWCLRLGGLVGRPLELTLDDLRERPSVTIPVTMECAGNGRTLLSPRAVSQPWVLEAVGTAEWTGTPLRGLLDDVGLDDEAVEIVFTGLDSGIEGGRHQPYARSLAVTEAMRDDVLVAYAVNGVDLPPQHGFPARLLVPGWYGMASVKWLATIEAVDEPFTGHQQARAYRLRQEYDEPGTPLNRIAVRSLLAPPGVPSFGDRRRFVEAGPCELTGRAWSGAGEVVRVEVSDDGGASWFDAEVGHPPAPHAWQAWTATWNAVEGEGELWTRATDSSGETQPVEPRWNLGGYAVNAVQRVPVVVGALPA